MLEKKKERGLRTENKRRGSEWKGMERSGREIRGVGHGVILWFGFIGSSARVFRYLYTQGLYIL